MRTELVTTALEQAVAFRAGDCVGTVFHSDHGSDYTAWLLEKLVRVTDRAGRWD